jgi:pre-mRNA cleavage complex 2 protein Pcf11
MGHQHLPMQSVPIRSPSVEIDHDPSIDLAQLKADIDRLASTCHTAFALNPSDKESETKFHALKDLQRVLNTETLPPQQLRQVRKQIDNLIPPPSAQQVFSAAPTPQYTIAPHFPVQQSAPPNIAPSMTKPLDTNSLAAILRQAGVVPAPPPVTPAPPVVPPNLAQMLAQFNLPSATPPSVQPVSQFPVTQVSSTPAPMPTGEADWLLNALKGIPSIGTPLSAHATPLVSEPMTRQTSASAMMPSDVELSSASMKRYGAPKLPWPT